MFRLSDSIMWWSDDVLGSVPKVRASLLELEALSAVWARMAHLEYLVCDGEIIVFY